MTGPRDSVPSSHPKGGTGNHPGSSVPGTDGNRGNQLHYEPLSAFLERAEKLPEVGWLIDGVLPEAGRIAVIAAPNSGKTWAALVFAHMATQRGREAILVLEEGGAKGTANRFKGLGFALDAPVKVVHLGGVRLANRQTRASLISTLQASEAPVLVLDPLSSIFDGNENDTEEMNKFKGHLEELARANPKALLIVLHHTSKGSEREGASAIHAGRGSSIMAGWADCQLNLKHVPTSPGSGAVAFTALVAKMRDGERGAECKFTIRLGASQPFTIEREVTTPKDDDRSQIREIVREAGEPLTKTAIAKELKGRKGTKLKTIDAMCVAGELIRVGKGYALPSKGSADD